MNGTDERDIARRMAVDIGRQIKIARVRLGVDQATFAVAAKVSLRTLRSYEQGLSMPPPDKLWRIAVTARVSVDELLMPTADTIESEDEGP